VVIFANMLVAWLLVVVAAGETVQLRSFAEIMATLRQGNEVRMVAEYGLCTLNDKSTPGPHATGGTVLDVYEYFGEEFFGQELLVFSDSKLIANYKGSGFIQDYVKTSIAASGQIEINAVYVSIDGKDITMNEVFYCSLNSGVQNGGVKLFTTGVKDRAVLDTFISYLTGEFDNRKQIQEELARSKIEHPFASHLAAVANDKIRNVPASAKGIFVLEESYFYNFTTKETKPSPFLFYFDLTATNQVSITSMVLPKSLKPEEIRNNNTDLVIDFKDLSVSPAFNTALYHSDDLSVFTLDTTTRFGPHGSFSFRLSEEISKDTLVVFEKLHLGNQVFPSYDSPLVYERVQKF